MWSVGDVECARLTDSFCYQVMRADRRDVGWENFTIGIPAGGSMQYVTANIDSLPTNSVYILRVLAHNSAGDSSPSNSLRRSLNGGFLYLY